MQDEKTIDVPDLVDDSVHILIWQLDEMISVFIGLILGLIFDMPFIGILVGLIIRHYYCKIRDGKPKGYILHIAREKGISFDNTSKKSALLPPLIDKFNQ